MKEIKFWNAIRNSSEYSQSCSLHNLRNDVFIPFENSSGIDFSFSVSIIIPSNY